MKTTIVAAILTLSTGCAVSAEPEATSCVEQANINMLSATEDAGGHFGAYSTYPVANPWYFRFGSPIAFREAGVGVCVWVDSTECRDNAYSGVVQCTGFAGGPFSAAVSWADGNVTVEKFSDTGSSTYRGIANAFNASPDAVQLQKFTINAGNCGVVSSSDGEPIRLLQQDGSLGDGGMRIVYSVSFDFTFWAEHATLCQGEGCDC